MTKKFWKPFYCAVLAFSLFFLSTSRVIAGLEVEYPAVAGKTITETSELPDYVLYLFNAGVFLGFFSVFISLIIAGAMYFLSPVSAQMRANAKDRFFGAMSGLLILVLTYLIVTTINPQLSALNLRRLPPPPPPPPTEKPLGVYLYKSAGCADIGVQPNTSSLADLGQLKNKINSVGIVHGQDSYISILYDNVKLWGKCQYIDPNKSCQNVSPFAASASIHRYDFNPNGDGVYFFRKACFNKVADPFATVGALANYCKSQSNGYYKVDDKDINGIYIGELENLKFSEVPKEEQDCIKYDKNSKCIGRKPPSLGGENISSIIVNGNYLVLFVYAGPKDNPDGPWTFCQEFPIDSDANKLGPQQIKWEKIRNSRGVIPNYVVIIPVLN